MGVEGGLIKIFAPLLSPIKRNQTPWAWPPLLFLPKKKSLEKGNWEAGDRVAHVPEEGGQAQSQCMRSYGFHRTSQVSVHVYRDLGIPLDIFKSKSMAMGI